MAVAATVTSGKIFTADEVVTISELNKLGTPTVDISGAVGTLSLSDGSVTNAKIAAATGVQYDKLEALATGQLVVGNAGTATATTLSGDATIAAGGAITIANDAVTTAKILDDNVTTDKILDDNVTTAKILDNNVTLAKLEDGTQGDVLYYGASGAPARLSAGTDGQVLTAGGAGANPTWEDNPPASQVIYDSPVTDATWTNSTNANIIHVRVIGGAGGQGSGAGSNPSTGQLGGRGASCSAFLDVSGEATVTYTVGAGGAGGVDPTSGAVGGDSSFGSYITSGGGAAGANSSLSPSAPNGTGSITTTEATAVNDDYGHWDGTVAEKNGLSDLRVEGKVAYGICIAATFAGPTGADGNDGAIVITVIS